MERGWKNSDAQSPSSPVPGPWLGGQGGSCRVRMNSGARKALGSG